MVPSSALLPTYYLTFLPAALLVESAIISTLKIWKLSLGDIN